MRNMSEVEKEALRMAWSKGPEFVGKVACTIMLNRDKLNPEDIDDIIVTATKIGILIAKSASSDSFMQKFESDFMS